MHRNAIVSMTCCVPGSRRRIASCRYAPTVQRTAFETQHRLEDSAQGAPLAGIPGGVYGTAVATPVFAGLRPPKSSCTPIVASGVATAGHFVEAHRARPWPHHNEKEKT